MLLGLLEIRSLFVGFLDRVEPFLRIVAEEVDGHDDLLFKIIFVRVAPGPNEAGFLVVLVQVDLGCFLTHRSI